MTTQLDASIGMKQETVYGTAVTVDRHHEFLTESLDHSITNVQGMGLRVGSRVPRSARRSPAQITAGGDIAFEAYSKGMGILFQAALGSATSTVIAAGTAYQQVHTPTGTDPLKSYTIQKGIPPVGGGATQPQTFVGCMCDSLEFTIGVGGILQINTSWKAKEMMTGPAYAAPTYPTAANGQIFTFASGVIVLGGTITPPTTTALATGGTVVAAITDASTKWQNNFDDAGFYIGGAGKRGRPNVVQMSEDTITGSLTAEYLDNQLRDAYLNQGDLGFLLTFTGSGVIGAGPSVPVIQIYVPCVRLDGEVPKANGGQVVTQTIPFHGLDNTLASSPFYVAYVTADIAI